MQVALDEVASARLIAYLALLAKWNRTYNLTAIREDARMVSHHLLDSLAVLPHLPQGRLLDVGSGAGLPGIPLAIAQPERRVTVLDSNHKKGAFLRQAVAELELKNVAVVLARVEDLVTTPRHDVVISRAFSDLADFVDLAGHCAAETGVLIAMKGVHPHDEVSRLPAHWRVEKAVSLAVPRLEAARHLLFLRRVPPAGAAA